MIQGRPAPPSPHTTYGPQGFPLPPCGCGSFPLCLAPATARVGIRHQGRPSILGTKGWVGGGETAVPPP